MRLDTSLVTRMDQRMLLAPRMIQSMEILQLPVMALQERIEHELQENPVLEIREDDPQDDGYTEDTTGAAVAEEPTADATDPGKELVIEDSTDNEKDFDRL